MKKKMVYRWINYKVKKSKDKRKDKFNLVSCYFCPLISSSKMYIMVTLNVAWLPFLFYFFDLN
jgi:hypothetical protein